MKILVLHGINLNMFGKREPAKYGTTTLAEIDARLLALGKELGVEVASFQTNDEGAMCERIQQAYSEDVDAVDSYLLALRAAVSAAGQATRA